MMGDRVWDFYSDDDAPPRECAPAPPRNRNKNTSDDVLAVRTGRAQHGSSSSGLGASSGISPPPSPDFKGREKQSKARKPKEENLHRFSWYKHWMSREEAEQKMSDYGENGSFVVRNCRNAGPDKPYVITILCRGEIFHVPIRRRAKDSYYAVGERKDREPVNSQVFRLLNTSIQRNARNTRNGRKRRNGQNARIEACFKTVKNVIKHFHLNPIDLILADRDDDDSFKVRLRYRASS